jgi:NitT/TauT family transport system ATP-binding protein
MAVSDQQLLAHAPEAKPNGLAPLVSLKAIGKTYKNGTKALAPTDLKVERSEFLTLLGPSGCGKSTILRLIAGLEKPSTGELIYGFHHQIKEAIGFVFQEPTLMPWKNVFENVYLPLRLQKFSRKDVHKRVMEALSLVGLTEFAEAFPRELSGGMKMRASIARALVLNPALLLMDEPFAALDEITRFKLNDDLLALKAALGMTIVFVTHSVSESIYLSSRIVILAANPGRIKTQIEIGGGLKRNEDFRSSQSFLDFSKAASRALREGAEP